MTFVVMRTGSPIYFNDQQGARGDQDTVPIIQYLLDAGHDIVLFGPWRGELPEGLRGVFVDTSLFNEKSSREEILEAIDPAVEQLRQYDPKFCLEFWGPPPTWSCPWNPNGARVFGFGTRYSLPMLYAIEQLQLERYGIVTDPKCYKRDLEMATMWRHIEPRAVLSQEERTFKRETQGVKYTCHIKYAACEFWLTRGMERLEPVPKEFPCGIAANTHIGKTGLSTFIDRFPLWREILDDCPDGTALCGTGWPEAFTHQTDAERFNFFGELPTMGDVLDLLNRCVGGPMIPQWPGFNSTKPRLYALANCVPMLYGNGKQKYTYDRDERITPLTSMWRWPNGLDLFKLGMGWQGTNEYLEYILERTEPNFSMLDDLIDGGYAGGYRGASNKDAWIKKFGGYYA